MSQIFVVTDRKKTKGRSLISVLEKVVEARADAIILREKDLPPAELYELACQVQSLCAGSRTKLFINSSVETALACGSAGVHLGFGSLPLTAARRILPHRQIGVSVHSVAEVSTAQTGGADYIMAGHIFSTASKPGQPGRGLDFIKQICAHAVVPVIAIGGITGENAKTVINAGASGVAVLSAIMESHDITRTIHELRQKMIDLK